MNAERRVVMADNNARAHVMTTILARSSWMVLCSFMLTYNCCSRWSNGKCGGTQIESEREDRVGQSELRLATRRLMLAIA